CRTRAASTRTRAQPTSRSTSAPRSACRALDLARFLAERVERVVVRARERGNTFAFQRQRHIVEVDACLRELAHDALGFVDPFEHGVGSQVALPRRGECSGRRRSVSVSTRLTKNEATEWIPSIGSPCATRRSRPVRKASITASYRSRLKINVMLTFTPAAVASAIAGSPASVAG